MRAMMKSVSRVLSSLGESSQRAALDLGNPASQRTAASKGLSSMICLPHIVSHAPARITLAAHTRPETDSCRLSNVIVGLVGYRLVSHLFQLLSDRLVALVGWQWIATIRQRPTGPFAKPSLLNKVLESTESWKVANIAANSVASAATPVLPGELDIWVADAVVSSKGIGPAKGFLLGAQIAPNLLLARIVNRILVPR